MNQVLDICIMKADVYNDKLTEILTLPQFEKLVSKRKNEKHPVLKEEERIISLLKMLRDDGKISNLMYDKLKPIGSQPPRTHIWPVKDTQSRCTIKTNFIYARLCVL